MMNNVQNVRVVPFRVEQMASEISGLEKHSSSVRLGLVAKEVAHGLPKIRYSWKCYCMSHKGRGVSH
jgi:hypothetical protein